MFRLLNNKVLSILFSHIISYTTLGNLNDFFLLLRSSVTSVSPLVRSSVIPVSPSFRSVTSVSPLLRSSFISVSPLLHSITSVLPIFRRFATKKEKPPTSGLKIIDATFNNKEGITMVWQDPSPEEYGNNVKGPFFWQPLLLAKHPNDYRQVGEYTFFIPFFDMHDPNRREFMFYPNVPWVATERETRFLNDYQVAISLLKPGSLTFFRGSNQVFTAKRGTQFTDPIIIAGLLRYFLDQGLLSAFLRLDIQVLRLSAYFLILPHPLRRDFGFKLKEIPKNNLLIKQFFHEDNWWQRVAFSCFELIKYQEVYRLYFLARLDKSNWDCFIPFEVMMDFCQKRNIKYKSFAAFLLGFGVAVYGTFKYYTDPNKLILWEKTEEELAQTKYFKPASESDFERRFVTLKSLKPHFMQQLKGFFGLMFREDSVEDREVSRVFKVTNYIRFNRTMTMGTRSSGLCNKLIPPYNVRVRSAEPAKERRRVELRNLRYTAMVKSFLNEHKKNLTPEERVASELRCKNIVIYDDDDFPIHGRTKEWEDNLMAQFNYMRPKCWRTAVDERTDLIGGQAAIDSIDWDWVKVLSELQKRAENWVFWRRKQKCNKLNKVISSGLDLKAYVAKRRIADKLDPIGSAKKLAESLARIEKDPLVIKERKIIKRMDPYTQCTELGYRISREYLSDPKKFYWPKRELDKETNLMVLKGHEVLPYKPQYYPPGWTWFTHRHHEEDDGYGDLSLNPDSDKKKE